MAVTQADGSPRELALRFGAELQTLHGTFEVHDSPVEARLALVNRLQDWAAEEEAGRKGTQLETGQDRMVLSWAPDALPIDGLPEVLADVGWQLVAPRDLTTPESREAVRFIRFGVTGVEAAFAATGSILVYLRFRHQPRRQPAAAAPRGADPLQPPPPDAGVLAGRPPPGGCAGRPAAGAGGVEPHHRPQQIGGHRVQPDAGRAWAEICPRDPVCGHKPS